MPVKRFDTWRPTNCGAPKRVPLIMQKLQFSLVEGQNFQLYDWERGFLSRSAEAEAAIGMQQEPQSRGWNHFWWKVLIYLTSTFVFTKIFERFLKKYNRLRKRTVILLQKVFHPILWTFNSFDPGPAYLAIKQNSGKKSKYLIFDQKF